MLVRSSRASTTSFEEGNGAALPFDAGEVDALVYHRVLCHVTDPAKLLAEAIRVLRPGGTLVVCDADFSKASLSLAENDPLQACADHFARHFVTDAHLVGKLLRVRQAAHRRVDAAVEAVRLAGERFSGRLHPRQSRNHRPRGRGVAR